MAAIVADWVVNLRRPENVSIVIRIHRRTCMSTRVGPHPISRIYVWYEHLVHAYPKLHLALVPWLSEFSFSYFCYCVAMVKQPSRAARSGARTIKRPGSATLPIYTRKRPSSEPTKVHVESVYAVTSLHIHCQFVAHVVCVCGETLSFCFCMVYMICH